MIALPAGKTLINCYHHLFISACSRFSFPVSAHHHVSFCPIFCHSHRCLHILCFLFSAFSTSLLSQSLKSPSPSDCPSLLMHCFPTHCLWGSPSLSVSFSVEFIHSVGRIVGKQQVVLKVQESSKDSLLWLLKKSILFSVCKLDGLRRNLKLTVKKWIKHRNGMDFLSYLLRLSDHT